jgi:hypothetical protein
MPGVSSGQPCKASRTSGCSSSRSVPKSIRVTVVSWPAKSKATA